MAEEKKEEPKLLDEPIPVKELLLMSIFSLEAKAWAYLGIVMHPETQKVKKDINEAKLAIDSIDALFKLIEPMLSNDEKKDIQVKLANLRLNFARE